MEAIRYEESIKKSNEYYDLCDDVGRDADSMWNRKG